MAIAENMPIMAIFLVVRMGSVTPFFFRAAFSNSTATTNTAAMITRKLRTYIAFSATF